MGEDTKIQWTHHTFNPWEGCEKISPGCKNCYAEARNERFHEGRNWGPGSTRLMRSPAYWREPLKWNREALEAGERRRVFCASLADVFEGRRELDRERARLADLIAMTPGLDWLLLTKRPENMVRLARECFGWDREWPRNVWAGTTAENRETLAERAPHLLRVPARVRFLSCEPLLEAVDLSRFMWPVHAWWPVGFKTPEEAEAAGAQIEYRRQGLVSASARFIDWVIVGGESGRGARPFHLDWARNIVANCAAAGVPCFVKQMGEDARNGSESDWVRFAGKGGDPDEWPAELRVRQFPETRA